MQIAEFPSLHQNSRRHVCPQYRRSKQQRIDAIKHATVAWKDGTGIFRSRATLDDRLDQVSELRSYIQHN